jgi:hypothetical protein
MSYVTVKRKNEFDLISIISSGECPSNWIISNNGTGCYFVSYIRLNFTNANLWCMGNQGRLIEIVNANIFSMLQSIKVFGFSLNNFYWIGLREIGANMSRFYFYLLKSNI